MKLLVLFGLVFRKLFSAERRDRYLHAMSVTLGYRVLAWERGEHQRATPPHDLMQVVKIALRE